MEEKKSTKELVRELREVLRKGYDWYFENTDGYCKSSEMMITISEHYPDYWKGWFKDVEYEIEVYSYVFCDEGRRKNVRGKNKKELLKYLIMYFKQVIEEYKDENKGEVLKNI